jgi:preprotein translocase subunit SecA
MLTRQIERAQRKVEAHNFDIRKNLLEYDDVANDQRKVIYQQRNELLNTEDISETITAMRQGLVHDNFRLYVPAESVEEQWDIARLEKALAADLQLKLPVAEWLQSEPNLSDDDILRRIIDAADQGLRRQEGAGAGRCPLPERTPCCRIRHPLREHRRRSTICARASTCAVAEESETGIQARGLRTVRGPAAGRAEVTKLLMTVEVRSEEQIEAAEQKHPQVENVQYHHATTTRRWAPYDTPKPQQPIERALLKVGRNDPRLCGSGKKCKHCHGKLS